MYVQAAWCERCEEPLPCSCRRYQREDVPPEPVADRLESELMEVTRYPEPDFWQIGLTEEEASLYEQELVWHNRRLEVAGGR